MTPDIFFFFLLFSLSFFFFPLLLPIFRESKNRKNPRGKELNRDRERERNKEFYLHGRNTV